MNIKQIKAAAVRKPEVFGKAGGPRADWDTGSDRGNPLSRYREHKAQGHLFPPPWSDLVCLVAAEDGTWGMGMSRHADPAAPIINDYFAPLLTGGDVMATELHWDRMVRLSAAYFGASGLASYAISALDLALWDLKGKLLRRPVYELLGGPARERIYCYVTGHDIDWYRELGFKAFKLFFVHGPAEGIIALEKNEAMIAEAREQVGYDVDLMLDLWPVSDVTFTVELGERLKAYRLKWLEDYLYTGDFKGYDEVRKRLPNQTLAAGERWYTHMPFQRMAEHRSVDIFQPDVQWVGGATAAMKVCHIAESVGIEIAMHAGCNDAYGQHLCYAMPNNLWGEFVVTSAAGVSLMDGYRPTPGMSVPHDGYLVPSDAPGFGIELTLEQLESAI